MKLSKFVKIIIISSLYNLPISGSAFSITSQGVYRHLSRGPLSNGISPLFSISLVLMIFPLQIQDSYEASA